MYRTKLHQYLVILFIIPSFSIYAQSIYTELAKSLPVREIGPALMGGRIADIAVNPKNTSEWYVAVGSGGVWKTTNSGVTWNAVFDAQSSYSVGVVAIDPNNTNIVWVGSGENVSGRHVGWGDGVYKSTDGGGSWKNMGLKTSEHIGRILIDPRDSDVVFVAAEGPLWSSGGERGLYKSKDGGKSWSHVLKIDDNTGVTDIEFDPSNPDVLYAAAYQRRRKTWSLLAGGPMSGIYKSTDNGETWIKLKSGLPTGDMGKIGLAVTPANPDLVYATIEANGKEKGFYRSINKGESWEKRNSYTSGGTGPHYYQEIEASSSNPDRVYQMDVFLHVTRDGGKTFDYLETARDKHSDNHALWIDPDNGAHLLAGTDGGLYESYDEGRTFRHINNLPIAQFYKLALDNSEPFYNVVAGAQDLGTLIGPSRTMNTEGIRNQDWYVPLGADGYDCAFDPEDPNTVYMEIQNGMLFRLDRETEQTLMIQPQANAGDAPERYNWDAPLLISPHDHETLYFGSQRVWKSTDRGNSWQPVSGDLTTNRNRYELKVMDNVSSVDALYDNGAMSKYATLTSISESPLKKGLLYTGSDDGLIQVSDDDGANWRRAGALPMVPALVFINDVEASKHDENVVFAAADAHKLGDYNVYLFMSSDRGKTWKPISGDLPAKTIVWSVKQDHIDPNLLFVGTEYGMYYSPNKGINWHRLTNGVPTIPFRDIELHERESDLVGASFGRGIFVVDDYSALRFASGNQMYNNMIFPVRDAWWYVPNVPGQAKGQPSAGSSNYKAANPPFGALITYSIKEVPKTAKEQREEQEKKLQKESADIPFPGWDKLKAESIEAKSKVMILISDEQGDAIRWLEGATSNGVHRTNWDLRLPAPDPIDLSTPSFVPPWVSSPQGPLVAPGTYHAQLYVLADGRLSAQGDKQAFKVKPVPALEGKANYTLVANFTQKTAEMARLLGSAGEKLGEATNKLRYMEAAMIQTSKLEPQYFERMNTLSKELSQLREELFGDAARASKDESNSPSIASRVWNVIYGHWNTTLQPTETQQQNIAIAEKEYGQFLTKWIVLSDKIEEFEQELQKSGAPYTPGRSIH